MKRSCNDCQKEYDAKTINIIGVERVLSPYCPVCRNARREKFDEQEKQEILRQEQEKLREWNNESGIPIRFKDKSFDDIINRDGNIINITDICREYADLFPLFRNSNYHSLILLGKYGVGKSHLACSIAKKIMDRWIKIAKCPVYYTTESALFLRIRSTYNKKDGETEDIIYSHIHNVPLLIIDDVGKEEVSDPRFVQRVWFHMVNGRYDNLCPMVITTNLDVDGLASHLGGSRNNEAAFDRLYEMLDGNIWQITGNSYRRDK